MLFASACSDGFTGITEEAASPDGKFRHAELVDRARRTAPAPADGVAGKGGDETIGVIVGLDDLEAYRFFDRYRFFRRYEYENVFFGFAGEIHVDDWQAFQDEMAANPDVAWFEPDVFVPQQQHVYDVLAGQAQGIPWGVERVGATESKARAGDGEGVVEGVEVYVLDTGVYDEDLTIAESVDFARTDTPRDTDGHGTHVAGTIAAHDDGDWVVGVAPGASVRSLKVLSDEATLADAVAALEHVVAARQADPSTPRVVNLSFGVDIGTTAYNALDMAVVQAVAEGIPVIVAAGNAGVDVSTVSPAHVAEAITVGAFDVLNRWAPFSNHGAGVDLVAPGVDVLSLVPGRQPGKHGLALMSGTSMAAAHVAGAAAFLLSERPGATPAVLREALVRMAHPDVVGAPTGTTDRALYIGGRLRVQPFFQHAVVTGNDFKFYEEGSLDIAAEHGVARNANVFANGTIYIENRRARIHGFGYSSRGFVGSRNAFRPAYNPGGLAATHVQAPIDVPDFRASAHAAKATRRTHGRLELRGDYALGTKDAPVLWYVSGDVVTRGDVRFSGYGAIYADGKIVISHDVHSANPNDESTLGLYTSNDMIVDDRRAELHAQVFLMGALKVMEGTLNLTGSLTARNSIELEGDVQIRHRPATLALTEPFWGLIDTNPEPTSTTTPAPEPTPTPGDTGSDDDDDD